PVAVPPAAARCIFFSGAWGVKVDPEVHVMEHNCGYDELNVQSAAEVFVPLSKFILDQLATRNYKAITKDIRDTVDSVSEFFEEPPWSNSGVAFNRTLIDAFLVSGIYGNQVRSVATVELVREKTEHLDVYKNLFYIRGKFACLQKRTHVVGVKTKKSFESLEVAENEFLFNLYVNPFSVNAWLAAADVFCCMSYEHLSCSAHDIVANLKLIRDYQRKSFHCYQQAICLLRTRNHRFTILNDKQTETNLTPAEQTLFVWGNFGFLCYSMLSPPMNGLAIKSDELKGLSVWMSRSAQVNGVVADGETSELEALEFGKRVVRARGMESFAKARKCDSSEWRYPFMLGKMGRKAGKSVEEVVACFEDAIELLPESSGTKEQETILDVQYCLVSVLCRGLWEGKVEPEYVIECLNKSTLNKDESMTPTEPPTPVAEDATLRAYDRIQQELSYIKRIDKKKWQHRPYWKSYWLYVHVYKDLEKAKLEILSLFQLRSNARSFINFWRPEFERPGRHYIYIHKYTMALISVLHALRDLESLRHLVRKTQKAFDVLLYPQAIWKAGFDAMTELLAEKVEEVTWVQFVKTIPQKEFVSRAPGEEKKMFWGSVEDRTEEASWLHTAFQLKKANEGMEDETV
ncbi:Histone transcription regulator 3, partial [Podochytrium sp. JEL0797]